MPAWKSTPPLFSLQDDEGATHEKLDFRLHFSCSSYLITTPCYRCVPLPHHAQSQLRGGEGDGELGDVGCEDE